MVHLFKALCRYMVEIRSFFCIVKGEIVIKEERLEAFEQMLQNVKDRSGNLI